jgi:hypothetical protein
MMRGGVNKKRGVSVHSRFAPLANRFKSLRTSGITSFSARTPTYTTIIKDDDLIFEFLGRVGHPCTLALIPHMWNCLRLPNGE